MLCDRADAHDEEFSSPFKSDHKSHLRRRFLEKSTTRGLLKANNNRRLSTLEPHCLPFNGRKGKSARTFCFSPSSLIRAKSSVEASMEAETTARRARKHSQQPDAND